MSWHDDCFELDELQTPAHLDALDDRDRARLLLELCEQDPTLASLPFHLAIVRARARLGEVVA